LVLNSLCVNCFSDNNERNIRLIRGCLCQRNLSVNNTPVILGEKDPPYFARFSLRAMAKNWRERCLAERCR